MGSIARLRVDRARSINMSIIEITDEAQFKELVNGDKPVLVDFFAVWCGPCKRIAPGLAELAQKYPNVAFAKVDVDDQEDIAQEYEVSAMPTFLLFKGGEKVDSVVGASLEKVEALVAGA